MFECRECGKEGYNQLHGKYYCNKHYYDEVRSKLIQEE